MIHGEALERARYLWGECAFVNDSLLDGVFYVGIIVNGEWEVKGVGTSWEKAFADAEREPV